MASIQDSLNALMTTDGAVCGACGQRQRHADGQRRRRRGHGAGCGRQHRGGARQLKTMRMLNLNDQIDDILITLGKQYHIIRPVAANDGVFFYLVLDKARANLALARRKTADVEKELKL
jgi:hypothetical protein